MPEWGVASGTENSTAWTACAAPHPPVLALVDPDARFRGRAEQAGVAQMRCFGCAGDWLRASKRAAAEARPVPWSAAIVAVDQPDINGIMAVVELHHCPGIAPAWISVPEPDPCAVLAGLCAGASGYVVKSEIDVGPALRQCLQGSPRLGADVAAALLRVDDAVGGIPVAEALRAGAAGMPIDSATVREVFAWLRHPEHRGPVLRALRSAAS